MATPTPNTSLDRPSDFDPQEFYSDESGQTLVSPDDLEETVPDDEKPYLDEVNRYWLNKPYSFAVIYHSRLENEYVYYAIEPTLSEKEQRLRELLDEKIRVEIDFDAVSMETPIEDRIDLIQTQTRELLRRWDLIRHQDLEEDEISWIDKAKYRAASFLEKQAEKRRQERTTDGEDEQDGKESETSVRSAPVFFDDDGEKTTLTPRQIEKMVYYLVRDFVGYQRIDPLKNDVAIEDISCNGPGEELFIDHQEYDQLRVANIQFDQEELQRFVTTLANMNGHGISRRQPEVDATLRDGSRAKLTLADEISTKGSNFTIRQFLDIPFTPVDLINWGTFDIDQMAYLWLAIEHGRSLIFAGGTGSGKTTTLNAVNLFAPASEKFVTIEDTAELELPQKNWVASITRPAVTQGGDNKIEEFDLVKHALRMRPKYIIMGEVRGEEGNALFQAMGSGHTSYTTFHADDPEQLIKRFSSEEIGVPRSFMDMIDGIVMLEQTRADGKTVRRSPQICEILDYDHHSDVVERDTLFKWDPSTDTFTQTGESNVLEDIRVQYGWTQERLEEELQKRRVVLAELVKHEFNTYGEVTGTIQGFMRDPEAILNLIADNTLDDYLENLQNINTLDIDVDEDREALVPRPDPDPDTLRSAETVIENSQELLEANEDYDLSSSFAMLDEEEPAALEDPTTEDGITDLEQALMGEDENEGETTEHPVDAMSHPPEEARDDENSSPADGPVPDAGNGSPQHDEGGADTGAAEEAGAEAEAGGEASSSTTSSRTPHPLSETEEPAELTNAVEDVSAEEHTDGENSSEDSSETAADDGGSESDQETQAPEQCIAITQKDARCRFDTADDGPFCHLDAHNPADVDSVAAGWTITDDGDVVEGQPPADDGESNSPTSETDEPNEAEESLLGDDSETESSLVPEEFEAESEASATGDEQGDADDTLVDEPVPEDEDEDEGEDAEEEEESEDSAPQPVVGASDHPVVQNAAGGAESQDGEDDSEEEDSLDKIFDTTPEDAE